MPIPRLSSEPPLDFPASRWDRLRADLAAFVESPWRAEAERLGWSELDLFGVSADRPYTRIDALGLVPALDGCRIVELSGDAALLETPGGARQSFRRRPDRPVGCRCGKSNDEGRAAQSASSESSNACLGFPAQRDIALHQIEHQSDGFGTDGGC